MHSSHPAAAVLHGRSPRPTSERRRRHVALLVAVVAGLMATLWAVPAAAGDPITDAHQKVQETEAAANDAAARYQSTVAERDQAQSEISSLDQAIPALRVREDQLRQDLAARAAALYRNTGNGDGLEVLDSKDVVNAARKAELTRAAAAYDTERVRDLHSTADRLDAAEAELKTRKAQLEELLPKLQQEYQDFQAKVAEANRALDIAEQLGALRAAGQEPVMGPSVLSGAEIAAWYRSTGASPKLSDGVTIDQMAQMYVEEGDAEGVRGDVAFAQAYIETGAFTHGGADNNFSGLGACDSCSSETHFPTARDGIRAQIQHLRNYADKTSRASGLHDPPSPMWYGTDPATAASNFDTFFAKGWAPTWNLMGNGNWATDPNYSGKVIGIYQRMIAFNNGG